MTITNNIGVIISTHNDCTADITVVSGGQTFTMKNVEWYGSNGEIFAKSENSTLTNAKLIWNCNDCRKNIWVFGDSYLSHQSSQRWIYYLLKWCGDNILINAHPGETSMLAIRDLNNLLKIGTPETIIWCLGMNDPDSNTGENESYIKYRTILEEICKNNGIELVFSIIPNTKSLNHTYKNAYIKASGYKYIDFAAAVGASSYPSTWLTGMLSEDNVHPSELGAKALAMRAIADFPKFMQIFPR